MHRVLYLSRGGDTGGSQRQLYHVLTNLDSNRYKPIVVCRTDGTSVDELRGTGIQTHVLPLRPWRALIKGMLRHVDTRRLARLALEYDVSLVHSSDLWLSQYLTWTARRIGVPSVLHVRAPVPTAHVAKHNCNSADSLIAISRRVRNNLLLAGVPDEKITLIGDSVDIDTFSPPASESNILRSQFSRPDGLLVGLVGRIEPFKRQLDFLRAAAQIVHLNGRQVTFFLIGKIHCAEYHQQVIDYIGTHGLADRVILTGERDDMPQVLQSLDMLVSLSGGSVMFEAMSCGKAVLSAGFTTKANSVHLQDGKTGLLVTSQSNQELVRAMVRLMDNPDLRKYLGHQARLWAENNFSHVSMAIKTQMLYDKLLGQYKFEYGPHADADVPAHVAAGMASAASTT